MKFISMDLTNFRQYRSAHIEFSIEDEKNVTLILGDNGSGKTTFVQAFYWCFYEENNFDDKNLINMDVLDEAKEGEELLVEVKIQVQYGKSVYEVIRKEKYEKNNGCALKKRKNKGGEGNFKITDTLTNRQLDNDQAIALIARMLPYELSKYFFFGGETMDRVSFDLFRRSKSTDIASVVQAVVGLRSLQQLKLHLKQTETSKRTLVRKLSEEIDLTGGVELQKISADIDKTQEELNDLEKKYHETVELIEEARKRKENAEVWLANHPDVVELEKEVEQLEKEKKQCAKKRDEKAGVLAETMKLGREKRLNDWLYKLVKNEISEIPEEKNSLLNEYEVTPKTIKRILDSGICICGSRLDDDLKHRTVLEELLTESGKNGKYRDLRVFLSHADKYSRESNDSKMTTESLMDEFADINDHYLWLDGKIKEKTEEMSGRGDEVKQKTDEKETAKKDIETYEANKEDIVGNRSEKERKLSDLEKTRNELREKNKENDYLRRCLKMTEEIYQQVANAYSGVEAQVREQFCECFQRLYDEIYAPGWKFEISNKYEVHPSKMLDQSQGQQYSMVLAFIGTALTLARGKNRNVRPEEQVYMDDIEQYPLVMDAPLSAFDNTRIRNISKVMPEIVQQWIIFIKDTDGEVARGHMRNIIGTTYKIKNHSRTYSDIVRDEI